MHAFDIANVFLDVLAGYPCDRFADMESWVDLCGVVRASLFKGVGGFLDPTFNKIRKTWGRSQ